MSTNFNANASNESPGSIPGELPQATDQITAYRLEEIRNARRELRTGRRDAYYAAISGQYPPEKAAAYYHNLLKSYLHELRPFKEKDERALALWLGTGDIEPIGELVAPVPPKPSNIDFRRHHNGRSSPWEREKRKNPDLPSYGELEQQPVDVWEGLEDVLDAPSEYERSVAFAEKRRHYGQTVYKAEIDHSPGFPILDQATKRAHRFAQHVGLEVPMTADELDSDPNPV